MEKMIGGGMAIRKMRRRYSGVSVATPKQCGTLLEIRARNDRDA
jgi:hypothetical protein